MNRGKRDLDTDANTVDGWAVHAKPDERTLLEREAKLLRAAARAPGPMEDGSENRPWVKEEFALLSAFGALYPDDVALQVYVARRLEDAEMEALDWGVMPPDTEAVEDDGFARRKALVRAHPNDTNVVALDASHCGGDTNPHNRHFDAKLPAGECIARFKKCLALAPDHPFCGKELARAEEDYAAPFCEGANVKRTLAFRLVGDEKPGSLKGNVLEKRASIDEPFLRAADVLRIRTTTFDIDNSDATKKEDGKRSKTTIWYFEVAEAAREGVRKAKTSIATGKAHGFGLFEGATVVTELHGNDIRDDGSEIDAYRAPDLGAICSKPERRTLPAD